jgi:hypothetical protein
MDEQNLDPNAGQGDAGSLAVPDSGTPSATPASTPTPGGQGQQPGTGNVDDVARYRDEVRRLNQRIVQLQRSSRQVQPGNPQGGEGESPFATPQQQYAVALKLATGELMSKLESIYSLYPEVPAEEINKIRRNPWAFVSDGNLYVNGDWEGAAQDIEYMLLGMAEKAAPAQPAATPVQPARVNNNPPAEPAAPQVPGSSNDEDPYTMPMDKLEQNVEKIKAGIRNKK